MKRILFILLLLLTFNLFAVTEQELWTNIQKLRTEGKYLEIAQSLDQFINSNPEYAKSMEYAYSTSCHYALAKKTDLAFSYLDKAIQLGFNDTKLIKSDTDFTNIQKDKRWKSSLIKIQMNYDKIIAQLPDTLSYLSELSLPKPILKGTVTVEEALNSRRSVRQYKDEALTLEDVSQLLWSAYGVTNPVAPKILRGGLKTAPSAGGLYPLEVYLYVKNVTGLEPGFYYYQPNGHKLCLVKKGDYAQQLGFVCYSQNFIATAPITIIYSAIFERTTSKYGERGRERYVMMDLGHSGENVYLQAEALNMGTVAIGAFMDLELKQLVNMTKVEEPLYLMPIGKKIMP